MTIGERIAKVREELGYSRPAFADALAVSRQTVYMWECGTNNASDRMLKSIANRFGISYIWLKEGDGDMFTRFPGKILADLAVAYDLDETELDIVRNFVELPEDQRKVLKNYLVQLTAKKGED